MHWVAIRDGDEGRYWINLHNVIAANFDDDRGSLILHFSEGSTIEVEGEEGIDRLTARLSELAL